jgi:hypothetical protein
MKVQRNWLLDFFLHKNRKIVQFSKKKIPKLSSNHVHSKHAIKIYGYKWNREVTSKKNRG